MLRLHQLTLSLGDAGGFDGAALRRLCTETGRASRARRIAGKETRLC